MTPLTVSRSFKSSRRQAPQRPPSLDANEFLNLLHGSNPMKMELNRLENEIRGEEQELIWTALKGCRVDNPKYLERPKMKKTMAVEAKEREREKKKKKKKI
ncbi:Microtubule-associated protein 70-1 [Camellia lanceoleosa]|uniref:Microtubule-associated protein 70-1 n=1 Tax=Camellia lanceoleosa TaxID=1840588 RepID=A0ACC0I5J7_9ERIC|nr:Microtubule-associated protein 70-1 [Camellia lanceoleosa]